MKRFMKEVYPSFLKEKIEFQGYFTTFADGQFKTSKTEKEVELAMKDTKFLGSSVDEI